MKKIRFYEIPYLGAMPDEDKSSFFYGMGETIGPECDVTFHISGRTKDNVTQDAQDYLASQSKNESLVGPGIGTAVFGIFAWPLAIPFVAWGWKRVGRRRVYKKAMEYTREDKFNIEETDLEEFYQLGDRLNLEEHLTEYEKMGNIREEDLSEGKTGIFRKTFSKFEDDQMAHYREEHLISAFEELETTAKRKWEETGSKAHRHVYKGYENFNKKLKNNKRLRSNPFDDIF